MGANWEQVKEKSYYKRREPELTDLYRVVYHHHEDLESQWEDLFYDTYGSFRRVVRETMLSYLDCGIVWSGCMRAECEKCNHSILVANSCKRRNFCPSCSAKRGVVLAEHITSDVLGIEPVRHIVFSVAKRVRGLFIRDRKKLSLLFDAAWKTIMELCKSKSPYANPGAILSVQTAGESLNPNPHLHGILQSGFYNEDGGFVEFEDFSDEELEQLSRKFAKRLLKKLVKLEIIEDYVADDILVQEHTGFSVWIGDRIDATDTDRLKFLTRYIERAPISLEKLSVSGDTVIVHSDNPEVPDAELSPLEFLARLSTQIPDYHESTLRYYGTLSYRQRGDKAKESARAKDEELTEEEKLLITENALSDFEPQRPVSMKWAEAMKAIFEIDPLCCPKCGSQMRFKAALRDHKEISRLTNHLGEYPDFHPPPPLELFQNELV